MTEPREAPSAAELKAELEKNPLAEMYRNHLAATEGKCWDCGIALDPGDSVNGYCSDCAEEQK